MGDLSSVDTKELGEAVDMIKDLSEAIYYCTVTKAMEEKEEERFYTTPYRDRDMDRDRGRMYYDGGTTPMSSGTKHYPVEIRDHREGRSPMSRRMYMEAKELHKDKTTQMHELDKYLQELAHDMTEVIQGASPEEKALLQKKLTALVDKIV